MRRFYHEMFTLDDAGTGDEKMWMRSADSKCSYINVVNHVRTFRSSIMLLNNIFQQGRRRRKNRRRTLWGTLRIVSTRERSGKYFSAAYFIDRIFA